MDEEFIPEEAKISTCHSGPRPLEGAEWVGPGLGFGASFLVLALLCIRLRDFGGARHSAWASLLASAVATGVGLMDAALHNAQAGYAPLPGYYVLAGLGLVAAGLLVLRRTERGLKSPPGPPAEAVDAIRLARRKAGVTLPKP